MLRNACHSAQAHSCGVQHGSKAARPHAANSGGARSCARRPDLLVAANRGVPGRSGFQMNYESPRASCGAGTRPRRPPHPRRRRRRNLGKKRTRALTRSTALGNEAQRAPWRAPSARAFRLNFLPFDRGGDGGSTSPPSVPRLRPTHGRQHALVGRLPRESVRVDVAIRVSTRQACRHTNSGAAATAS